MAELDLGLFQLPILQPADAGADPVRTAGFTAMATGPRCSSLAALTCWGCRPTHPADAPGSGETPGCGQQGPQCAAHVPGQCDPTAHSGPPGPAHWQPWGCHSGQTPPGTHLGGRPACHGTEPTHPMKLASAGFSLQGAGLVIQKNLPAAMDTTLNGNLVFANAGAIRPQLVGQIQNSHWRWLWTLAWHHWSQCPM